MFSCGKGKSQVDKTPNVTENEKVAAQEQQDADVKPDAIDRFFGFTESLVCAADNTTNVQLDPQLLEKEEPSCFLACGQRNIDAVLDDEHVTDACRMLLDKLNANKQKGLESANSDDFSGNTESITLDGEESSGRKRGKRLGIRRIRALLSSCKDRAVENSVVRSESNSVVVSATPRATHYEVSA
jgi:hypothetical protein